MIDDFKSGHRPSPSLPKKLTLTPKAETQTESFKTPEEVAASEPAEAVKPVKTHFEPLDLDLPPAPSKKTSRFKLSWPPSKRQIAIFSGVMVVLISGAVTFAITHHSKPTPVATAHTVSKKVKVVTPPKPTTVASTLSGLQVDPSANARPVTGVMIENSTFARPQSGLISASVVFEAIAEGGITRFLALYQDTQPTNVGPIRSARPYYEQWALGFDAGYAHVGGSPEALDDLKTWNVRDLDQFYNGNSYHRVSSRDAPHNVYTGIDTLTQLEISKGYAASNFTGFTRKVEAAAKVPTAKTIDIAISGPVYNAHYDYDGTINAYRRSEGGAPHVDAESGTQLTPKVVVAMVMPYGLEADGYHSSYTTIGSGQAFVFQDGTVTPATWNKASATTQFTFTDAAGKPINLNPGQTWLTAVGTASAVSSAP